MKLKQKPHKCDSGITGWKGKLQDQYEDFADFEHYDDEFYKINDDFVNECEEYLQKRAMSEGYVVDEANEAYQDDVPGQTTDWHQSIMNQAYKKWNDSSEAATAAGGKRMGMDDWFNSLEDIEQAAVATGKLNQQVENGGFSQWNGNGYQKVMEECLLETLPMIGGTASKTVLSFVEDLEGKRPLGDMDEDEQMEIVKDHAEEVLQYNSEAIDIDDFIGNYGEEEVTEALKEQMKDDATNTKLLEFIWDSKEELL